jgi:AraC-like DNA-binding protein
MTNTRFDINIEQIASQLKVYEGTIMRLSEYFGLNVYDFTVDGRISSKAILTEDFIRFLEDNEGFYKKYHDDYYAQKNPATIAKTLNRSLDEITDYLITKYPDFFEDEVFKPSSEKNMKYISSYEIDFELGNQDRLNMNTLGKVAWHLGFKQQMVIDQLRVNARNRKLSKKQLISA